MTIDPRVAVRKLRKLRRDPTLFLYDYFRKRMVRDLDPIPGGAMEQISMDIRDVEVVDDVAVLTDPAVVRKLDQLKHQRRAPGRRVTLSWWS